MFVMMTLAGLKQAVSQWQVKAFEAMGWTKDLGADQGNDAVKKDAPSQKSPKKEKKNA